MNTLANFSVCVVFALFLLAAGCGRGADGQPGKTTVNATRQSTLASKAKSTDKKPAGAPNVIVSTASWAQVYDLGELASAADLIVEGTIKGIEQTRALPPLDTPTVYTDFRFDISKVLKAYPGFSDESVTVIQFGGTLDNTTRRMEGNDLFRAGERVLLFLRDASDDPVHTPQGETKFSLLMPGGRFTIQEDGAVENPTKDSPVADTYNGKELAVLEDNITAAVPDATYYIQNAATASLIVEGIVGNPESRLVKSEDTQSVYTVYPFRIENIIYDDLVQSREAKRKPRVYQHSPVRVGDEITVFERGGTFQGVTQRWAWSWEMKPGTRMLLFLGNMNCGDRPILCTQNEMESNTAEYLAGGGARFVVNEDGSLTAVTRDWFSRLYDGAPKENLTRDVIAAREQIQAELNAKANQPTGGSSMPPPPTETK